MKRLAKIGLFILINLLVVEATLRVQQNIGPFYDLVMEDIDYSRMSEALNHVPRPMETWTLGKSHIYGEHAGHRYTIRRDTHGVRINALRPDPGSEAPSVLFLGDSFVDGYDDAHTLVQAVSESLPGGDRIRWLNAGHSSYSPAILIPQARALTAALDPDFVVVVIDQTDLGDDVVRYEQLTRRDAVGNITGVNPSPPGLEFIHGLQAASRLPFYLARAVAKIHHTRIHMPRVRKEFRSWNPGGMRQFSRNPLGGAELYPDELDLFGRNLDELLTLLVEATGSPQRVLIVSHPHIHHFVPDSKGMIWRDLVGPAVQAAAERQGVPFYLAGPDLLEVFEQKPERYYWVEDMHFNFEGIRRYGSLIADQLPSWVQNSH